MNNKNTIKKLLTTASTLAVLASGSSAFAAGAPAVQVTNRTGDIDNAAAFVPAGGGGAAAFTNGNSIQFGDAHTVTINVDSTIDSVDINGKAAAFEVAAAKTATIGNVADKAAGGTLTVNYDAANAATVVLNGTKYNQGGAAASLVFDFKGKASTLKFSGANATFTGTIRNTAAANAAGTVQISANTTLHNTLFAPAGGGLQKVKALEVDGGTTLTLSGTTSLVDLNDETTVAGNGKVVAGKGTKAGDLQLVAAGVLELNEDATAGKVTVTANGIIDAKGTGTITEVVFNAAGSTLNLSGGTVTKITANNANDGKINVFGSATITQLGNNAAAGSLNFTKDATLTLGANAHAVKAITADDKVVANISSSHNLTVETVKNLESYTFAGNNTLTVSGQTFEVKKVDGDRGAAGGARGKVEFADKVDVTKTIFGAAYQLSKITLSAAPSDVNFGDSLKNVEELNLANAAAKAEISSVGNKEMKITAAAAGHITLTNEKDLEVAKLGANGAGALGNVTLKGKGNVTVSGDSGAAKIIFEKDAAGTTLSLKSLTDIAKFETVSEKEGGVITFKEQSDLVADLGAQGKSFTALKLVGTVGKTLDLKTHSTFGALVLSEKTETLTLTGVGGSANATTYGGFGEKDSILAKLTFSTAAAPGLATISGNVYTNNIDFDGVNIAKVKFEKSIYGKDANSAFTLTNAAHDLTFADGAGIESMKVAAAAGSTAKFTFEGSTNIGEIGGANNGVASVAFSDKKGAIRTLNGDLNSKAIELGAGSYKLDKSLKFTTAAGATTVKADAEIQLGDKVKLETGAVTVAGKAKIKMHTSAQLTGAANALTTPENLTITIDDNVLASGDVNTTFITYQGFGNLVKANAQNTLPTIVSGRLLDYKLAEADPNTAKLVVTANKDKFIKEVSDARANETAIALARAIAEDTKSLTGSAKELAIMYNNLETTTDTVTDSLQRIAAAPQTAEVSFEVVSAAMDHVNTRSSVVGVGAGDENSGINLGVWGEGFASRATQKARKGDAGFKVNTGGATVGVDAMVSDRTVLGLAATYSSSTVKFSDQKSGDKAKLTNMMFSVYGTHDLGNSWFVRGIAGFGTGSIKSDAQRVTGNGTKDVASAKYDSLAFSFEGGVGYDYKLSDSTSLVPALALRYTNVNEGGFTEKGSAFNRTVTKKSSDKITGIFGASVLSSMDLNGSVVTPEAHAYVNYDLKSKKPKIDVKLDGLSKAIDVTGAKLEKLSYNLGTSLTARSGAVEYGAGYDARLASKYVSHQGTLKVKVDL